MNFLQTLKDVLLRFISIDKNIETLEKGLDEVSQINEALNEKLQKLTERVVALENTCATKSELQESRDRITKIETEQTAYLREVRAATAELVAERKGLAADAREIIARIQTHPPQLPPTQPTTDTPTAATSAETVYRK